MQQSWPSHIWIVRHGESAGNVARDAAMMVGATHIDITERDVDVPLSKLGEEQARAVGRWFADLPGFERPEIVFTSPYVRAVGTAKLIQDEGGIAASASACSQSVGRRCAMKGAQSHVVSPDGRSWLFTGGGVGLATSGSGDVLTGLITSLLARGTEPAQAALWGVYLHGEAGRILGERIGPLG